MNETLTTMQTVRLMIITALLEFSEEPKLDTYEVITLARYVETGSVLPDLGQGQWS